MTLPKPPVRFDAGDSPDCCVAGELNEESPPSAVAALGKRMVPVEGVVLSFWVS